MSEPPRGSAVAAGSPLGGLQVHGDSRDQAVTDVEDDRLVGPEPAVAVVDGLAQLDHDGRNRW